MTSKITAWTIQSSEHADENHNGLIHPDETDVLYASDGWTGPKVAQFLKANTNSRVIAVERS